MAIKEDHEVALEEMMARAQAAPEPGSKDRVVSKGDVETPPMVLTELTSAGYVWIYETDTGERSKANRNMLDQLLKIRNKDGTFRFTTKKPDNEPVRGTLKCMLHADDPNRAHYAELGLPVCRKSNLTAPYMVEMHMRNRHPSAWATIEKEKFDKEKEEDRAFQRLILKSGLNQAAEKVGTTPLQETVERVSDFKCDTCGKSFINKFSLDGHKKSHGA
jgi:hypothetical protein